MTDNRDYTARNRTNSGGLPPVRRLQRPQSLSTDSQALNGMKPPVGNLPPQRPSLATSPVRPDLPVSRPRPGARPAPSISILDTDDDFLEAIEVEPEPAPPEKTMVTPAPTAFSWENAEEASERIGSYDREAIESAIVGRDEQEFTLAQEDPDNDINIDDFLHALLSSGGSDLHLSAKCHPSTRINGDITPLTQFRKLSGEDIQRMITDLMTTNQRKKFEDEKELDFAYSLSGQSRFRVNVFIQQGHYGVVMRAIPWEIKTVEELNLPAVIKEWGLLPRGLILITGPTGSGKSTTLAAILDYANATRSAHIMTIEDPVEFVHTSQKSIVNQREVGEDTHSFTKALKHVLRQDPDIILIGELRDYETISIALTAAETGHLVLGTLHTQSAQETISRIIDVFPDAQQPQVRTQLSSTLKGVACQTLLKSYDGKGRRAALEIMVGSTPIAANIRSGKIEQLQSYIQGGKELGMITLDDRLTEMVRNGDVHWEEAANKSTNRTDFINKLGGEAAVIRINREIGRQKAEGLL